MPLTCQDSIRINIQNGRKYMKYMFPRNVGATTFLVTLANERIATGEKVLFMVSKLLVAKEIRRFPNFAEHPNLVFASLNTTGFFKGTTFDTIIADNMLYEEKKWNEFLANTWPVMQSGRGFVLDMNTVE